MYWKTGKAITGHEYMKLEKGPAPRYFLPLQQELIESGDAAIQRRDYFGFVQKRLIAGPVGT